MNALVSVSLCIDGAHYRFGSLQEADAFKARRRPPQEDDERQRSGRSRVAALKALACGQTLDSATLSDEAGVGTDAMNGVLRQMVAEGLVEIAAVETHNRRIYRILPRGRYALGHAAQGVTIQGTRIRALLDAMAWMHSASAPFCTSDLAVALSVSKSGAANLIKSALAQGLIEQHGEPVGTGRRQYYTPRPFPHQE